MHMSDGSKKPHEKGGDTDQVEGERAWCRLNFPTVALELLASLPTVVFLDSLILQVKE